jgi:1,4-alpha-glucan branching enzyme
VGRGRILEGVAEREKRLDATVASKAGAILNQWCHDSSRGESANSRILCQAARELLLAQSSDWAFLIHSGTAGNYPRNRFEGHLANFHQLLGNGEGARESSSVSESLLANLESRNNLFPELDPRSWV